jgi:hypothetical protein
MFSKGTWSFNLTNSHCDFTYWDPHTSPDPRAKKDKFIRFKDLEYIPWIREF